MKEIWKDIPKYEGLYQISNTGKVKSLTRTVLKKDGKILSLQERFLKPRANNKGYLYLNLCKKGKCISHYVHVLVGNNFVPNPENKPQFNHKDGNKLNNNNWNLEPCTNFENHLHATRKGLKQKDNKGKYKPRRN